MVNPILTLHEHSVNAPKYLVISFGTAGDMHPFLSLAKALQSRGEDVTFMGFKAHEAMVLPLGIPFVPVGTHEDYFRVMHDPDLWHPRCGFATLFKHMGQDSQSMRDIAAHFQSLASDLALVVLAHPFAIPSTALFRQHLPLMRLVGVYLAPSNLRTVHDPLTLGELAVPRWLPQFVRRWMWRLVERFYIDPAAIPPLNAWRAQYDLPAIPQYMDHIYSEPDASLALFPAWFGKPQPDWPSSLLMGIFPLFEPDQNAQLSPELSQFLQAGSQPNDRPIVFAPGSAHAQAGSYFAKALKVVERLGLRAIFLTPYPEQLPKSLPASVLWQSYVPFDALLPKVRALVHHGGIGTTAQALRAGVPQLVVPFAFDQFDNAARVELLGCGLASLAEPRTTAFYLTRKIQRLLDSEAIRAQCTTTAARFSNEPPMDELIALIISSSLSKQPFLTNHSNPKDTPMRLQNKHALVTAAGQGIGRASALAMAAEGAQVLATDLNPALLESLKGIPNITTQVLDVMNKAAIAATIASLPKLNVLFNCAGFVHHGNAEVATDKDWDFAFDLNVRSQFWAIQAALPVMLKNGGGSIINMASIVSVRGLPNRFIYGASKAAVIGLTKAVAIDYVKQNIRCNCLCPGTVDTPSLGDRINAFEDPVAARKNFIDRQPMGRLASADEIAPTVVFLASDESSFYSGEAMHVNGGMTI